jgi:hypothetical protein
VKEQRWPSIAEEAAAEGVGQTAPSTFVLSPATPPNTEAIDIDIGITTTISRVMER